MIMKWANRNPRKLILALSLLCGILSTSAAADFDLRLLPCEFGARDGGVEFELMSRSEPEKNIETGESFRCTQTPSFRVCSDLGQIYSDRFGGYYYVFYARSLDDDDGWAQFRILASTKGSFLDQIARVDFKVISQDLEELGSLHIPFYNQTAEDRLVIELPERPVKLWIGKKGKISLKLGNRLRDLHLLIYEDVEISVGDESVWQGDMTTHFHPEDSPSPKTLPKRAPAQQFLTIELQPAQIAALNAAIFPYGDKSEKTKSGGIHDKLTITVPYSVEGNEQEIRSQTLEIPVRFRPLPLTLGLVVILGSSLGTAIAWLRRRRHRAGWKQWLRAAFAAALIAIATEAVALVLVEFDSELKFLGLELDPFQPLPAFTLGILMGLLGFRGADWLKGLVFRAESNSDDKK